MKRYEVTGKLPTQVDLLTDRAIGDVFEADLDPDQEKMLVDAGALKKLPAAKKTEPVKSDAKEKEHESREQAG